MDEVDKTILLEKMDDLIEYCNNNDQIYLACIIGIAKGALLEGNTNELHGKCNEYARNRILAIINNKNPNE